MEQMLHAKCFFFTNTSTCENNVLFVEKIRTENSHLCILIILITFFVITKIFKTINPVIYH